MVALDVVKIDAEGLVKSLVRGASSVPSGYLDVTGHADFDLIISQQRRWNGTFWEAYTPPPLETGPMHVWLTRLTFAEMLYIQQTAPTNDFFRVFLRMLRLVKSAAVHGNDNVMFFAGDWALSHSGPGLMWETEEIGQARYNEIDVSFP